MAQSKDVRTTPAGIHDNFSICGINLMEIFRDDKYVTQAEGKVRVDNLSTDLIQGMSIKAYDGGKEVGAER